MYSVKVYSKNYDKEEFYTIMGKYFAEKVYKKEMPYLFNDKDKVWYLFFDEKELVGFCGVKEGLDCINFMDIYVDKETEKENVLKFICNYIFKIYQKKSIKVITDNEQEIEIWLAHGFKKDGTKGHYQNLVWADINE